MPLKGIPTIIFFNKKVRESAAERYHHFYIFYQSGRVPLKGILTFISFIKAVRASLRDITTFILLIKKERFSEGYPFIRIFY